MEVLLAPRFRRPILWITALAIALTRFAALSDSMWDWDEALFSAGIVEFDISEHRPHPPGFPLFIALAKLVRPLVSSEFAALQAINLAAALLAFPVAFALARAVRFDFGTSWLAAVLFAFFPNVWFFGGTGFSDVPAVVLAMAAATLLLRSRERHVLFVAGCAVAGVGMGIRPQNVVMAVYPALIGISAAIRTRRFGLVIAGGLVTTSIVAAAFGGAIIATGSWERYRSAVEWHRNYIATIDSYLSPHRPSVVKLLDDFYVDPIGPRTLASIVAVLAVIGLLRGRRPALETLAIFGPFAFFALFMLDHWSANRFSIAYMPLLALTAAEGARVIGAGAGRLARQATRSRVAGVTQATLVMVPAILVAFWAWPGIRVAATTDSPSNAACRWIRENLPPGTAIVVHSSMWPFAAYGLSDYHVVHTDDGDLLPPGRPTNNLWVLSEGLTTADRAVVFTRPRHPLAKIARSRYFEVHVHPASSSVVFGAGWFDEETDGASLWRWMGPASEAALPPIAGDAVLAFEAHVPDEVAGQRPTITLALDGRVIDRIAAEETLIARSYRVQGKVDASSLLTIEIDRTVSPAELGVSDDRRRLGLQLRAIRWSAATPE